MNTEAATIFRALSGRQIMAIDRDHLFSAIVMAEKRGKVYADQFPDDEPLTEKPVDAEGGVRVIPLQGIVSHGENKFTRFFLGMTETDHVATWIQNAVADPAVKAIVLNVSSPGGYVTGTGELANVVAEAAKQKPIIAHTSTLMASAAYWISAGASLIYATPSATVGSIGVFTTHLDMSRAYANAGMDLQIFKSGDMKAAGIGGTSLTDAQKANLQADIDAIGVDFRAWVSANRLAVLPEAMDGRAMSGKAAFTAQNGLVDSLADLKAAIRDAAILGARADKSITE